VLNVANLMSAVPGPTATLTLRYRRPTPLRADLVFEAWIASVEGRKVTTRGQVRHGETVTVEAEGLFIAIDTERIQRLAE
jgi:acyl-CoA thioesterase FadM